VEYVLIGAASWFGASLLAGAGWALFHIDVRAREDRARSIRADRRRLAPTVSEDRDDADAPSRRIAS
jgi:hypothetical protein